MANTQEKMIRVNLIISGTVQGVFFRTHAQKKAEELGVTGWVANEADGTVVVIAEGSNNKINEFINWCHGGPSTAQVDKVHIEQIPYMREFEEFSVRY